MIRRCETQQRASKQQQQRTAETKRTHVTPPGASETNVSRDWRQGRRGKYQARCVKLRRDWQADQGERRAGPSNQDKQECLATQPSSSEPATFSTARKASCGMSTWPTRFMRRLPSFCFSRSLRLREMSPP